MQAKITRRKLEKLIDVKKAKIQSLRDEITSIKYDLLLLCDKEQRFEEKMEEVIERIDRKKSISNKLIGRIYWKEDFVDEDTGKVITIERSHIVRVDGEWQV